MSFALTAVSSAQAIQTILAPAVMISACGLMLLGLQNKYGRINDRMRLLARERMDLIPRRGEALADARMAVIDRQLPELKLRLQKQHDAVLYLFWAVAVFVLDSFLIALSLFVGGNLSHFLAISIFLAGMALVLIASLYAASEITISTRAVNYEIDEIIKL